MPKKPTTSASFRLVDGYIELHVNELGANRPGCARTVTRHVFDVDEYALPLLTTLALALNDQATREDE